MFRHLRANLWLVITSLVICCVLYPLVLLGIGQTFLAKSAQGSLITNRKGVTIGSRLLAQPFTGDQYFQPRPSAASFDASNSSASNLAASNCQLRDRVAQALGPIARYAAGPKKGKLVGPDIETWFAKDAPGAIARWADTHPSAAKNWITGADRSLSDYISDWQKSHEKEVADWIKDNPAIAQPQPADLAAPFFKFFSSEHPGKFPSAVDHTAANGKTEKKIDLVSAGSDVQSVLFDLWLQAHPDADLERVPADLVTTSGSGLDPDITLDGAEYQLVRVAGEWANRMHRDEPRVREEIQAMLEERATAPLDGLVGVKLINVLEMDLALRDRYEPAGK